MKTKPLTILIPELDDQGFCSKECPLRNGGIGSAYRCPYSHYFFKQPDKGCPWYKHAMKKPTDELVKMLDGQIAELRATIAAKDKEIERLKEQLRLTNIDWQNAEAENAVLRERLRPAEEVYKKYAGLQVDGFDEECKNIFWEAIRRNINDLL